MLLLRKAHLGEVSVTVWPKELKEIGARKTSTSSSDGSRGDQALIPMIRASCPQA